MHGHHAERQDTMTKEEMLLELREMKEEDLEMALRAARASRKTREEGLYFLHHFIGEEREIVGNKPKISIPLFDALNNPLGIAHGGVIAFLADNAMGYASSLASQRWGVTVDMHIRYHRPGVGERLIAIGEVVSQGKTFNSTRTEVRNEQDKLVATATGTFYFRPEDANRR